MDAIGCIVLSGALTFPLASRSIAHSNDCSSMQLTMGANSERYLCNWTVFLWNGHASLALDEGLGFLQGKSANKET